MNILLLYLGYLVLGYLVGINLRTLSLFALDKRYASTGQRRITENKLLQLTAYGGRLGALAGMSRFRHKISKSAFLIRFWKRAGIRFVATVAAVIYAA